MSERFYWALASGVVLAFVIAVIADAFSSDYTVPNEFYLLLGTIFGGATAQGYVAKRKDENDPRYLPDEERPPWDY